MQQCPVPTANMRIAFHQSLTLSPTGKGMLQLRAHGTHKSPSLHTEMLRNAKGRCSTSSHLLTGMRVLDGKKHVLCTELGLKEEWGGTSQCDRL